MKSERRNKKNRKHKRRIQENHNSLALNYTNLIREKNNLNMCRVLLTIPDSEVSHQGEVMYKVNMR